jgi:hypothetical protein
MSVKKLLRNGKCASRVSIPNTKHSYPRSLNQILGRIYDRYQQLDEPKANAAGRKDFVFHMSDWIDDLRGLAELFQNPKKFSQKQAGDIVAGFLFHVIPHLRAAGRLLLDYTPDDIFLELETYWSKQRGKVEKRARRIG